MRSTIVLLLLATCGSVVAKFDVAVYNPCESPSLPHGSLHLVVAGYEEKNCFTDWLWSLGLTNARVFVYRRLSPERPLSRWAGPCGMTVEEKLVLPNYGKEAAIFHDYVLEHYNNPPSSVIFLHGHGPHAYHTDAETVLGRSRLFYRSMVVPSGDNAEFAHHMISLTRFSKADDPIWMQPFTESSLSRKLQDGTKDAIDRAKGACMPLYKKWDVETTSAGFYTCCAQFILPWERILRIPKQFYAEALEFSIDASYDDIWTSRFCWEHVVWAWYQEPAPSHQLKQLYLKASQLAKQYNVSGATDAVPMTNC